MVSKPVVASVRNYLKGLQKWGFPVCFGIVFGSQASGRADQWSDIDLLVVSPRFDGKINRQDVDSLWRMAVRTDSRIEPFPCGEKQWREDDKSAIVEIARRRGELVAIT